MAMYLKKKKAPANTKTRYVGPEALSGEKDIDLSIVRRSSWLIGRIDYTRHSVDFISLEDVAGYADKLTIILPESVFNSVQYFQTGQVVGGDDMANFVGNLYGLQGYQRSLTTDRPDINYFAIKVEPAGDVA